MSINNIPPEISPPDGIRLAFFDLDETITYKDTDLLWALWRSRRSPLGWFDLLRLARINRLYYSHTLTPELYGSYHLNRAGSMKLSSYRKKAVSFATNTMKRYVYPSMTRILAENRDRGIRNVLITAQDEIIGRAFAEILGLDGCIASSYITEGEKITGMNIPLCFQEGKVHWAQNYLDKEQISWSECAFYTDSLNDLPLLEVCAYPVCVHPGDELTALAVERDWPVFRPGRPET